MNHILAFKRMNLPVYRIVRIANKHMIYVSFYQWKPCNFNVSVSLHVFTFLRTSLLSYISQNIIFIQWRNPRDMD